MAKMKKVKRKSWRRMSLKAVEKKEVKDEPKDEDGVARY